MEAAIIFCRTALHRLQTRYKHCDGWLSWFDSLHTNASVEFIRSERDFILKEAPQKVHQVIRVGQPLEKAKTLYYYVSPEIPAVDTIRRHVCEIERVIREGESRFGDGVNIEA